jgi:hypothetical protein
MEKKGQIAIFVIIAVVIVAVLLAALLYPRLEEFVSPGVFSPSQYLLSCIEPEIKSSVSLLASQGGYKEPMGYATYKDTKVKYLCYTSKDYTPCIVQQPALVSHFSEELNSMIGMKANACAAALQKEYERRGYSVSMGGASSNLSLSLGKIDILFSMPLVVSKADERQSFDKFDISINSNIYDILSIASSIVEYEAVYGDSETTIYAQYYPNIKINKIKLEDGVKVYIINDAVSEESFAFATRSLVWPQGYGE